MSERNTLAITVIFIILIISVIGFEGYHNYHWNYNKEFYLVGPKENPAYNLLQPDTKFVMPPTLQEISGITFLPPNKMACIQDEDGILFIYNLEQDRLEWQTAFGGPGDYEDISFVENQVYIIDSKGNIYHFKLNIDHIGEVTKLNTPLTKKNNCEGLTFNPAENQLLIACKEDGGIKKNEVHGRAIYAFSLDTDEIISKPKYIIMPKSYNKMLDEQSFDKKKHKPFKPSALAIHPFTREVYVIASVGKILAILESNGKLKQLIPLNSSLLKQPEGICFDLEGNLYICSEGREDNGYILKFNMLNQPKN